MSFSENFEAAKNLAMEAAQTAAAKAKELAAVAKANISIYAEEDKVKKAEIELGKLYYRDYAVGEELDSAEYLPWCQKIDESKKAIAELKDFIASLREDEAPAETEAAPTDDDFEIVGADDEPKADETPAVEAPKTEEAPAEEAPAADPQRTYVALGDSIVSGVGLPDFKYTEAAIGIDAAPNFEGYPEQCYVSLVGKGLGLDRQHAINLGLPGLTTGDLADMLHTGAMPQMNQQAGTYYVYPQMLDYLKRADVISVQIGSNDALVPALVALGNATNWKSEQLVATMVSGVLREPSFENLQRLNSDLSRLRLTREEKQATTQLLLGGGTDAICEQAYQEAAVNMPQVVAELRALNPDAQIILLGYTNPVPLLPEWTQLFRRLNALSKSLAAQNENVTYVPIPFAMTATDAHPTVSGHKYIANRILRAIKK